ncbi:hypothetical protein [Microbacterium sp. C7(2022)]|uniref:hypothetical protein n=1 Tax=Microbacterium sp. C7(2022) TaxID=2992759 RepID=UPI00237A635D|nr:hypothetical protein [Microbacterium sp. C7(2022)]MDE0545092.1 hypothetical protein [Microbacterium sp. C7(2022)]
MRSPAGCPGARHRVARSAEQHPLEVLASSLCCSSSAVASADASGSASVISSEADAAVGVASRPLG